jgi:hypothetical protein
VDDILLESSDKNPLLETKRLMSSYFYMEDITEASYVFIIEIHQDR